LDFLRKQGLHLAVCQHGVRRAPVRVIELMTDLKIILVVNGEIDRYTYNKLPMPNKYEIARYNGNEEDFDRVLRHHPMRGGRYSATFNNCQHFAANFLLLLEALAKGEHQKSFEREELYSVMIDSAVEGVEQFGWNKPNLYLDLTLLGVPTVLVHAAYVSFVVADVAAGATVTTVKIVPATGNMGWLGAGPTVTANTVAAPYAAGAATVAAFAGIFATVWSNVGVHNSWKRNTKVKHLLVSGFPSENRRN
jgi:hypothetical protein